MCAEGEGCRVGAGVPEALAGKHLGPMLNTAALRPLPFLFCLRKHKRPWGTRGRL